MAWLRLAGVLITLPAAAILLGGGFEMFGAALALADALAALIVTGAAMRRTRKG